MTALLLSLQADLDLITPYCEVIVGLCMISLGGLGLYRACLEPEMGSYARVGVAEEEFSKVKTTSTRQPEREAVLTFVNGCRGTMSLGWLTVTMRMARRGMRGKRRRHQPLRTVATP